MSECCENPGMGHGLCRYRRRKDSGCHCRLVPPGQVGSTEVPVVQLLSYELHGGTGNLRPRITGWPVSRSGYGQLQAQFRSTARGARQIRCLDRGAGHPGHQCLVRGGQGSLRNGRIDPPYSQQPSRRDCGAQANHPSPAGGARSLGSYGQGTNRVLGGMATALLVFPASSEAGRSIYMIAFSLTFFPAASLYLALQFTGSTSFNAIRVNPGVGCATAHHQRPDQGGGSRSAAAAQNCVHPQVGV